MDDLRRIHCVADTCREVFYLCRACDHGSLAGPQRYKVQFTASEEYVALLEEAQALLAHALPGAPLEEVHLRAMRVLVAELKKRKYAVTERPRSGRLDDKEEDPERSAPRRRGRTIPASVRRAVSERDGCRCTYVDSAGQRCRETHRLEFHHIEPFARGGPPTENNITLRCAAHNALAAEQDFGRDLVEEKQDAHASFRQSERENAGPARSREPP